MDNSILDFQEKTESIIFYFSLLRKKKIFAPAYLFVTKDNKWIDIFLKYVHCQDKIVSCSCSDCRMIDKKIHPDISFWGKEDSTIKIEDIRNIQQIILRPPVLKEKKVIIIQQAHNISYEGQAAFLKTLEEPTQSTIIVLVTLRPDLLSDPLRSRCRILYFPHISRGNFTCRNKFQSLFSGKKIKFTSRQELKICLEEFIELMRDIYIYLYFKDKKYLLRLDSYEIINQLPFFPQNITHKLTQLIRIYKAVDNINLNFAAEIINFVLFDNQLG